MTPSAVTPPRETPITGTTEFRVRYEETDQAGVVYHSNYVIYFEIGRTELLRSRGLPYRELEEAGTFLTVVETHVRHQQSARYDDWLRIETTVDEVRGARLLFSYRLFRAADNLLLATGSTTLAGIDGASGRPKRVPDQLLELLR